MIAAAEEHRPLEDDGRSAQGFAPTVRKPAPRGTAGAHPQPEPPDRLVATEIPRLRVLHVFHNSLPLLCGYSIRSGYIVRLQKQQGLEPFVVTSAQHPNGPEMREEIDGVTHLRTPSYRGRAWPLLRERAVMAALEARIAEAAREWRPDLIHAHSPVLVGIPAARVASRTGVPLVYEVRDLWENASVDRKRFGAGSPLYVLARFLETRLLRRADAVVTICETLHGQVAPRSGRPEKVHVVANGVDVDSFSPGPEAAGARERLGVGERRLVLYAGTFQPYEGLGLLVESLPRILSRVKDAHLLIVGGAPGLAHERGQAASGEEAALRRLVGRLGLEDRVTLTGLVPHAEMKALYTLADVVVYPRLLTLTTALTTPLKPLEAMAMARAVVVSDVPPLREMVREGETGLTFPAGDPEALAGRCVELLADSERRAQLGHAARDAVVAGRQWSRLVGAYRPIYERVRRGRAERGLVGRR